MLFFLLLLPACFISNNWQVVLPDYENRREFGVRVLAMPLNRDLVNQKERQSRSAYENQIPRPLSSREVSFFYNYMAPALSEMAVAEVIGIDPLFKPDDISFTWQKLQNDHQESTQMYVPSLSTLKYRGKTPAYLIFFQDLYFIKLLSEERNGLGKGSSKKYTLEAGLKYLIWDNRKQKIAAYGELEKQLNLFEYPSKDIYLLVIDYFAQSNVERLIL